MIKKVVPVIIAIVLVIALVMFQSEKISENPQILKIAITQIATHPGIDAIRQGFLDEMDKLGYKEGIDVVYEQTNAQGDMTTTQSIAQKMVRDNNTLLFAISTPSSQSVAQAIKGTDIPLIFGAVTDPVEAGLVQSMEKPGGNITGTSDQWPVEKQFELLLSLVPNVKKIGLVYNPGETNSESNLKVVEKICKDMMLEVLKVSVSNTSEVYTAARSLVGKCDAMYVPADNTVISAMDSVVKVAEENDIPLLPGVSSNVEQGGFGTLGPDYYDVGVQSARLADRVIKGEKPGDIPVAVAESLEYFFNKKSARKMGVTIPDELLNKAVKVYE